MDKGEKKLICCLLIGIIIGSSILIFKINSEPKYDETLYDENASCHLAIGDGFSKCYENGENMSREELLEKGVNHSNVHTDFMVGTSDLTIVGTTWDGEEYTVFENGNFVLKES